LAAGADLPLSGNVFVSVRHSDKDAAIPVARKLVELGFTILATSGTAARFQENDIACISVNKISQGRPHILDKIEDGEVQWILNTSAGTRTTEDSYIIRRAALDYHIPYSTTLTGGWSMALAVESLGKQRIGVKTIQEFSKNID